MSVFFTVIIYVYNTHAPCFTAERTPIYIIEKWSERSGCIYHLAP